MSANPQAQKMVSSYESILVPVPNGDQLHVAYLPSERDLATVLLMPGIANNCDVFREQDYGLAEFLLQAGYSVFMADLRGKGRSWPKVNKYSGYGLNQMIQEDIPAVLKLIEKKMGVPPQYYVCQGAGGLIMSGFLSRNPDYVKQTKGLIYFGSRRTVVLRHWMQRMKWEGAWQMMGQFALSLFGYLPGKLLGLGNDNESQGIYNEYMAWCNDVEWVDCGDQFNYSEAMEEKKNWPASLYFASHADRVAHPKDVSSFMKSLGRHDGRLVTLGKKQGNLRNYSHSSMIQHRDATLDHFPLMIEWMAQQS
ncbi:MAG: hypothetical protein COB04_04895 [Gammaproteobacteria bacterium]|nr:MAG: hypothetical protein COB04_04895 [Gammaproteobacteria bacterium]